MTRKCHNHTLQTNPRHREEESQSTNSKAISSLFPREIIAKLGRTLNTTQQNKYQTQKPTQNGSHNEQWININRTTATVSCEINLICTAHSELLISLLNMKMFFLQFYYFSAYDWRNIPQLYNRRLARQVLLLKQRDDKKVLGIKFGW